jgi:pSer/pThr/pTyr-binding forkhead associated (FHA) protein
MANLFLVRYPEAPVRVPEKGSVTIGRADTNTIVLSELRVSRKHASIDWDASKRLFLIGDLGSANGTWLNGMRLAPNEKHPLNDWDKIRITSTVLTTRFVTDPATIKNEFKELRERMRLEVTEFLRVADIQAGSSDAALTGNLQHLCVVDLFQMLESSRKTGVLSLQSDAGDGTFTFSQGAVFSAGFGKVTGEKAVYEVLKCNQGSFAFVPQAAIKETRKISTPITVLLMEGCRQIDEANASGERAESAGSRSTAYFSLQ